jgi:predicted enzyme related to lactoylglutathione lyase
VNFNGILIGSEDPKRLAEYYTRLFGKPMFDDSGYTGWQIGSAGMTVGPHSEVHGRNGEPGRIIWNIETPDVRGEFDRMKAAGAVVIREPYTMDGAPTDSFIATLEDPDGNYFQLMSPMDPTAM